MNSPILDYLDNYEKISNELKFLSNDREMIISFSTEFYKSQDLIENCKISQ